MLTSFEFVTNGIVLFVQRTNINANWVQVITTTTTTIKIKQIIITDMNVHNTYRNTAFLGSVRREKNGRR